jgi:heme oxygenase (mycobilin-producing)
MHFRPEADEPFVTQARDALRVLAERPGFGGGTLSRSLDDSQDWVLVMVWDSVGAYRRALGSYQVKLTATALLTQVRDLPSSFETLVSVSEDGAQISRSSDLAPDAKTVERSVDPDADNPY